MNVQETNTKTQENKTAEPRTGVTFIWPLAHGKEKTFE